MIIWVDAQFSPAIATWITERFGCQCVAVRDLGLRDASDREIFLTAREAGAAVMTKDSDFIPMLDDLGAPPQIVWVTCGNTSNARLKVVLDSTLASALALLESGERLVEITGT